MAFLMIDVDDFKKFNDQHGHLVGDQILRQVAATIRLYIREIDLAGRFGGEEFCVILPNAGLEGARLTAERICKAISDLTVVLLGVGYRVTISVGVALYPKDGAKTEEIVEHADQALYQAKHQGRNCVCLYDPRREIPPLPIL